MEPCKSAEAPSRRKSLINVRGDEERSVVDLIYQHDTCKDPGLERTCLHPPGSQGWYRYGATRNKPLGIGRCALPSFRPGPVPVSCKPEQTLAVEHKLLRLGLLLGNLPLLKVLCASSFDERLEDAHLKSPKPEHYILQSLDTNPAASASGHRFFELYLSTVFAGSMAHLQSLGL